MRCQLGRECYGCKHCDYQPKSITCNHPDFPHRQREFGSIDKMPIIISAYKKFNDLYGYHNEIEIFNLCSDYGCELNESTIDKIVVGNNHLLFYYNENTGEYEYEYSFSPKSLADFLRSLLDAVEDECVDELSESEIVEWKDKISEIRSMLA